MSNSGRRPFSDSRSLGFQFLALFLVVVGARLTLIHLYGSALPYWDQWDGEAAFTFKPWMEGSFGIADLFKPHNEHRIVISRLLAMGLLWFNGQWDPLFEMVVNALLCGLLALVVAAGLIQLLGRQHRIAAITAVMIWLSLPYAQENTLWGFQSSFYFLILFSFIAIWGLLCPLPSARWWVGASSAVLACLTIASGYLASAVILGIIILRISKRRQITRSDAATLVFTLAIVCISLLVQISVPHHARFHAASFSAWLLFCSRSLSWPFCEIPAACLVIYAPTVLLALRYLGNQDSSDASTSTSKTELLLACAGWVIIQSAGIALMRGCDGHALISSRHMDIFAIGALVNFCAAVFLLSDRASRPDWLSATFAIWVLVLLVESVHLSYAQMIARPGEKTFRQLEENNVRRYVATGDSRYLEGPGRPIPYPSSDRLASLLRDPSIRPILPAGIREPIRIEKKSDTEALADNWRRGYIAMQEGTGEIRAADESDTTWFAFSEPRELARFSYYTLRLLEKGELILLVGVLLWAASCVIAIRRIWPVAKWERMWPKRKASEYDGTRTRGGYA